MEEAQQVGRGEQDFSVTTTAFEGEDGQVRTLRVARADEAPPFGPVEGTDFEIKADLVLLAMGFLHPEQELLDGLGVDKDGRGNIKAGTYETSVPGVFAAGDARRGQSLIVWAINEGRQAARMVDRYLGTLPSPSPVPPKSDLPTGNTGPADEGPEGPPRHVSPGLGPDPNTSAPGFARE